MMKRTAIAAMLALFAMPALAQAQDPRGTWMSQSRETKVKVSDCGGSLCGNIVWTAKGGNDANNPDAALKNRPLNGVRMITFKAAGDNSYTGQLYDYTSGKTYSGKMSMDGANTMKISGCVFGGLICRSQSWTRAN